MHTGGTQAFAQPPRRGHFQHTLSGRAILPALLSVFTGTASFAATLQLSLRGPILFCLARKEWGEKRRWRRVILRAHARDFLAAPRGLNALFGRRIATIPMAFGSVNVPHAFAGRLHQFWFCSFPEYSADYDVAQHVVGADAHIGPANIGHHRRIRRWPAISTAACFAIPLRGNCFRWERCLHAGGAVVQLCRKFIVCWPQRSSRGFFCGLRYNPIRIQRLFLPTFSGKTEKVGLRSNGYGLTANSALRCQQKYLKRTKARPAFRQDGLYSIYPSQIVG